MNENFAFVIPVTEQTTAIRRRTDFIVLVECKQRL